MLEAVAARPAGADAVEGVAAARVATSAGGAVRPLDCALAEAAGAGLEPVADSGVGPWALAAARIPEVAGVAEVEEDVGEDADEGVEEDDPT